MGNLIKGDNMDNELTSFLWDAKDNLMNARDVAQAHDVEKILGTIKATIEVVDNLIDDSIEALGECE